MCSTFKSKCEVHSKSRDLNQGFLCVPRKVFGAAVHVIARGGRVRGSCLQPDVARAGLGYMTRVCVGWCRVVRGIGYEGQNLQITMEVFSELGGKGM